MKTLNVYWELFFGGTLTLLALASSLSASSPAATVTAVLATFLFAFYIARLSWRNPFFAVCSLPVLFTYVWFVISFCLFEFGAYTPELRMTGSATGGTGRLAFFLYLFVACAHLTFARVTTSRLDQIKPTQRLSGVIPLTLCLLLSVVLVYAVYGTAIGNDVDRIQFRTLVAPKIYFQIVTVLVFLSFFLGVVRRKRKEQSVPTRVVDGIFLLMLLLLILGGEKFSLLLTAVSLYVAPAFHGHVMRFNMGKTLRYALLVAVGIGAVVGLAINQYTNIAGSGSDVSEIVAQLLFDRISQQAELNFYFDKLSFVQNITHGDAVTFIENELLGIPVLKYHGIQLLMNAAAPSDLFAIYADAGVTFGDGFPGILFYYFGWSSAPIIIICGCAYGLLSGLCIRASMEGRIVSGLILFYIFYNISLSAFLNGELYLVLDITISKLIAIGILLSIVALNLSPVIIKPRRTVTQAEV